jgi:hypothetical protein
VAPTTRANTFVSYSATVRLHINPHVGHIPLAKLAPQQVQAMVNDLVGSPAAPKGRRSPKGLSPHTAGYARIVLRVALNQALAWNLVHRNAAALAHPPSSANRFTLSLPMKRAPFSSLSPVIGSRRSTPQR